MEEKRRFSFLLVSTSLLVIVAIAVLATTAFFLFEGSSDGEQIAFMVARGSSISKVSNQLHEAHIIKRPAVFKALLRLTNGTQRLRAGEFALNKDMGPLDALLVLYQGDPILHKVTIPEGYSIRQIDEALEREGLSQNHQFMDYALSKKAAFDVNIDAPNLEGFLFPDTYSFSKIDSTEVMASAMVRSFKKIWTEEMEAKASKLGFTQLELITLASIVEKETGTAEERQLISSVFHNRLQQNMRLQSDPTTIYGIKDFDGNLTKAHLLEKTPYNTYKIKGLPPGPIANPGLHSIQAALEPASTEYLYFVAARDGKTIFSKTYREHTNHVNRHQKLRSSNRRNAANP